MLESLGALGVGLGSLVAPLLVKGFGATTALVVVGLLGPVCCVIWWRPSTRIDRSLAVRTEVIDVLRKVPMLRPLPVPAIEQLAQNADPVELTAGQTLFNAGDSGDQFFVVVDGEVDILDGTERVRTMTAGEGFGEIALLGHTTRTMTVRASAADAPVRHLVHGLPAGRQQHLRGAGRRPRWRGRRTCVTRPAAAAGPEVIALRAMVPLE